MAVNLDPRALLRMTAESSVSTGVENAWQLEEQIVHIWPDYACLYDVRSPEFKNREKTQNLKIESCVIELFKKWL